MSTITNIPPLAETAGSAAYSRYAELRACSPSCPPNYTDCGQVNFQARGDEYVSGKKKNGKGLLITTGILATGAAAIIGLAYTHKLGYVSKLKDGGFKNFAETVTGTCHNWCSYGKNKGLAVLDSIKEFFKGKAN